MEAGFGKKRRAEFTEHRDVSVAVLLAGLLMSSGQGHSLGRKQLPRPPVHSERLLSHHPCTCGSGGEEETLYPFPCTD